MTLRWLHLSDTHFREEEFWDRRATLRALIAKVAELEKPDVVFITGDVAWSGKPKEYEQATRFFAQLNEVLQLEPKDRWFMVPGNHDVDRSRIKAAHRAITKSLQDEETIEELLLHDPDSLRSLSTRLDAYYNFAASFVGPARAMQPERPWRTDVREFDGVSIGILQLNSAWTAEGGKTDDANLLIGEAQVREALDATPDESLRIALVHHPLRNLRDFDENRVESLLGGKGGAAFLLRGHLHLNRTRTTSSPDGNINELAAGTLYTDEAKWPRGFQLGELDLAKGDARIQLFRYSDEGAGFFAADNLTYENAPKGICKIKVPSANCLGGKKPKPSKARSKEQQLSITARYRAAAAAYHGHARFIGFPNQATRPNARVSDLFVPLRMKPRERSDEVESRTTAEIARRLLSPKQDMPPHFVVLGDPGSGKTTLTRFLVMLAAGAITMPGVDVVGTRLPLRIALGDFVGRQRDNPSLSLIDYLDNQAKTELSLVLPKHFLKEALDDDDRAVLFLDGLDEVGAPEHRAATRDLVAAFAAVHSHVPLLVTSRIAGYHEASLSDRSYDVNSQKVQAPFQQLVLETFNDHDLRLFVTNWYTAQEPADTVARDRGIADLMAALSADERVHELARTPLLATLIAMIHRVEANLPGERAKLYELCVRMLLETWPAQARRPFVEIDAGLQRAYLESMAFVFQLDRAKGSSEAVTFTGSELVKRLLPILQKRDFGNARVENVERLIVRWIDHLEKQSGILIEQRTGVYAFCHLSIMEYLAAKGMERERGRNRAVAMIAGKFSKPEWREVCLLAVGMHAEDGLFLDDVYQRIQQSESDQKQVFLLECLREEARFQPEQREAILCRHAPTILESGNPDEDLTLIDQIRHFSVRNGGAVQSWIEKHLMKDLGDDLTAIALVAQVLSPDAVETVLRSRADRSSAAGTLLEFWPASRLGDWAAREVDAASALQWSRSAPHDLSILRSVAGVAGAGDALPAALMLSLMSRTLNACSYGTDGVTRVAKLQRPGGLGLPAYLSVEPGQMTFVSLPRVPRKQASTIVRPHRVARVVARQIGKAYAYTFATELCQGFPAYLANNVALDVRDTLAGYVKNVDIDASARAFPTYFGNEVPLRYARGCANFFASDFTSTFAMSFADSANRISHRRPLLKHGNRDEDFQRAARCLLAAMASETWIAHVTMADSKREERLAYFRFRLQNRLLLELWPGLDERIPANPSPFQLALYFALGWSQATTTWAWPDSDRWRGLFEAGPGKHWLARSQWHLCRLTDDPESESDDAALRAALHDGYYDESLPGYAARLGEIVGIAS